MYLLLIALAACCLGQTASKAYTYRGARMAATVHTWTNGDEDGDWGNVNNWNTGALPGTGGAGLDSAIFDGILTQVGPSVNLDRALAGDAALHKIILRPNFAGSIGGSGNYLKHRLDTSTNPNAMLQHHGSGHVYFLAPSASACDALMAGPGHLHLQTAGTGVMRNVYAIAGIVTIESLCQLQDYLIIDGVGALVTMESKADVQIDPLFIVISAGTLVNKREIVAAGRVVMFGGEMTQTGLVEDDAELFIGPAARFVFTPSGTITASYNPNCVVAGLLDGSNSNQDIEIPRFIRLQLANVRGTSIQAGEVTATTVDVDLREEYP